MPEGFFIPQTATREAGKTMGVYKMTFPGGSQESLNSEFGFRSHAFMGRRFHIDYRNLAQPSSKMSLEAPEMEHFTAISEDEHMSESVFTGSTRTSNTISDDDSSLMEFASRTSTSADDFAPARHSTACCSDLAFRRELRKRFRVEPVDEDGLRLDSPSSFALGQSFRRELEKEDRMESLALWEETSDHPIQPARNNVVQQNAAPHSWHAGDTAASSGSTRNKGLDNILRRKKASSFFSFFFSGLSFSSSRKSRKSLG